MGTPAPQFIPEPFANLQTGTYLNYPIPDAPPSSPANLACWQLGFQSITMQPEVGGGLPPFGQDFNGILKTITTHTYALQAGQWYLYDGSFATSISGYSIGAFLGMDDGTGFWLNTAAANSNNPDTTASASGWAPFGTYGTTVLSGLTGGTITPTDQELKYVYIILEGALTSNLIIDLPQSNIQQWLFINSTTGSSYTTTVKTAAGGSSGIVVPQGGLAAPVGLYTIGDGNVYPTVSPFTAPIDQAATPLTLVERDNLGQGYFLRVNLSSAFNENPFFLTGAVLVQNNAHDSFGRWASTVYFLQQIFTSPALTGAPTAPTAAVSDNSTKIATTAFVKALLGGTIFTLRTGTINIVGNVGGVVVFSPPFPTACLGGVASVPSGGFQPGCGGYTPTQMTINGNACGTQLATYLAWGN